MSSVCLQALGFRFCFTPLSGFFSPFPHGTCSLSVTCQYLALGDGPPVFTTDSSCPVLLSLCLSLSFIYKTFTFFGSFSQMIQLGKDIRLRVGLFSVRSPLLGKSSFLSFPPVTQMFQFTGSYFTKLCIYLVMTMSSIAGFPHSETQGSWLFVSFPQFSFTYVLLRLHVPRHPPCALSFLTRNIVCYLVFIGSITFIKIFIEDKVNHSLF